MLTGNLVRVRVTKDRVIPQYLARDDPRRLEAAEGMLWIFRDAVGRTRGEIEDELEELLGADPATLVHRGLAKVLEDRAEFEVVADLPPEQVRAELFGEAASRRLATPVVEGRHPPFARDAVVADVAARLQVHPAALEAALFADLKDENRMTSFEDTTASRLVDRYNVALAQAVLLRSVRVTVEIRGEKPARYRQIFRKLKFHRLLYRVEGSMAQGYVFQIDGPLSLFSATNKYGLQIALFLPALLHCEQFRLEAEVHWGPRREPRRFLLEARDGLVPHTGDEGVFVPAEQTAFLERFRQVARGWEATEATDVVELGGQGVWVPDYRFTHVERGLDVSCEVLGFWKRSSVERLLALLPKFGPPRYVLAISDRLKVDEEALGELNAPVLRFKEIPNASEMAALLEQFLAPTLLPPESRSNAGSK